MALVEGIDHFFGQTILGIDEAGRGPLAGPVVAAGVVLDKDKPILGLRDSKKLTESARESLYQEISERALFISIQEVDAQTIDQINILQATLSAMRAVLQSSIKAIAVDVALIDGNRTVAHFNQIKQIAVVKGDNLIESIMAASIMAKVHRDRIMHAMEERYQGYGFSQHKGYGTKAHIDAILKLGPCPIHRMSFAPLKSELP